MEGHYLCDIVSPLHSCIALDFKRFSFNLCHKISVTVAAHTISLYWSSPNTTFTISPQNTPVPPASQWSLQRLDFNDFSLDGDQMVLAGIRMFKDSGLLKKFKIEYEVSRLSSEPVCEGLFNNWDSTAPWPQTLGK